jgi:hypothetical protein
MVRWVVTVPTARRITVDDLVSPLEIIAQLDLSDDELRQRGLALQDRQCWDGLGDYAGCYIELATGEQFLLRRFDFGDGQLDVLGLIERDPREQVARLLAALGVERSRVRWEVPLEAWRTFQIHLEQQRREQRR